MEEVSYLQKKLVLLKKIDKKISLKSSTPNENEELTTKIDAGDIEFLHVWFRYPNTDKGMWILRDFNLKVNAEESGCGKSTIAAFLYKFYELQEDLFLLVEW